MHLPPPVRISVAFPLALLVYVMIENADLGDPEAGAAVVFACALIAYAVGVWLSQRWRP